MSSLLRKGIIGIVLLIVAVVVFKYFTGETTSGTTALGSSGASNSEAVRIGNEFRTTLNSIRTLSLNNTLFIDPAFVNLRNFVQPLTPAAPGRQNPFAPIGSEGTRARGGPSTVSQ